MNECSGYDEGQGVPRLGGVRRLPCIGETPNYSHCVSLCVCGGGGGGREREREDFEVDRLMSPLKLSPSLCSEPVNCGLT